jgi:diacylglycerol kinase (ATP)
MALKILVIHNPIAGRRRRRRVRELLKILDARGHHVRAKLTTQAGDAHEAARDTVGLDIIVAAGGDGTVNEVVNGLCSKPADEPLPAIAFLPLGTANVLAWELRLPRSPAAVADLMEQGHTLAIQPGIANGRRFLLMASAGLDARAVAAVKTSVKRVIGGAAYVSAALKALGEPRPSYKVAVAGQEYDARTVIVTRASCYGGPFRLVLNANLASPALHVVIMQGYGWWSALRYGAALVSGRLHCLADVRVVETDSVEIEGPSFDPVQMDGDLMATLPLSISIEPQRVLLVTAGHKAR